MRKPTDCSMLLVLSAEQSERLRRQLGLAAPAPAPRRIAWPTLWGSVVLLVVVALGLVATWRVTEWMGNVPVP